MLVMFTMYIFATIHMGVHWVVVKNAFLNNGQTEASVIAYLFALPLSSTMLSGTLFCANSLIADSVLVSQIDSSVSFNPL